MSGVRCFWIEPTGQVQIWLRRYVMDTEHNACAASGYGYHNASVRIEDRPAIFRDDPDEPGHRFLEVQYHMHDDERWPKACACGRVFVDADQWQVNQEHIYRRADTGEVTTLRDAPAGAMWNSWWYGDHYRGADGISLSVMLPGGYDWPVDGPSYSGGKINNARGWTRSGTVPVITARPSILIPGKPGQPDRYHGFLTDGVLNPC